MMGPEPKNVEGYFNLVNPERPAHTLATYQASC